jgi:hypothetical protein
MSGFGLKAFKKLKEESVNIAKNESITTHLFMADDFKAS